MLSFHLVNWWSDNKKNLGLGFIVLVTIAACAVLAPRIALFQKYSSYILVAITGILGVGFLIKFPQLGLVGLVGASLVVPFSYGTGSESSLNISILLVGLMAGLMMVDIITHRLQLRILYSRPILPVFFMLVISILAFVSGQLLLVCDATRPVSSSNWRISDISPVWFGFSTRDLSYSGYILA